MYKMLITLANLGKGYTGSIVPLLNFSVDRNVFFQSDINKNHKIGSNDRQYKSEY